MQKGLPSGHCRVEGATGRHLSAIALLAVRLGGRRPSRWPGLHKDKADKAHNAA